MLSTGRGPTLRSPSLGPAQSRPAVGAELCGGVLFPLHAFPVLPTELQMTVFLLGVS